MSGLLDSLNAASNALIAQRMGLDVVGQNLANINTPGYSRRTLDLAEVAPTDPLSAGRGVTVVAVRALRDQLVDARLRREQGNTGYDGAMAEVLGTIEAAVGMPGASLDAQLTAFFDAFSALASDPTSPVARDGVVRQGTDLTSAFHDLAAQLTAAQTDADTSLRASVNEVNALGTELAGLNGDIAAHSYDAETIRDRQGLILQRLGELADVSVLARQDGGVDVTLASGRALVIGDNAYALQASPTGMATVSLEGVDVTPELTGGRLGGLLRVRDAVVPGYMSQLDQLANDFATAVNATHATGFDATGAAAGNFFAPPAGVAGAAAALSVDAAVLADSGRVAASATGAPGDNGTARQLSALRTTAITAGGTHSAIDAWRALTFDVGNDVSDARAAQTSHGQIVTQLQALQAQASGVSYDEEAAHMMRYQRAYEANARYFKTITDTLDALMDMVQ
jgi:flagellar hook-associated protein 1 FlgK